MDAVLLNEGSGYNFTGSVGDNTSQALSLCSARFIKRHFTLPLDPPGQAVVRSFQFLYFLILLSLGGVFNCVIVWAVVKSKKLWTIDVAISLQIVAISLLTIAVVLFPGLVNIAAGDWVFGAYSCSILGFVEHTLRSARRSLMVALALDRFLLVFFPFKYPKYHVKAVLLLVGVAWVGTILFRIVGLPGILDCYTLASANIFCTYVARCSPSCAIFGYTDFVLIHAPFYILPTILYLAMYIKSKKIASSSSVPANSLSSSPAHATFFLLFVTSCACYLPNIASILVLQIVVAIQGYSPLLGIMLFTLSHSVFLLVVVDAIVLFRNRDIKAAIFTGLKDIKNKIGRK